ncbi:MAG: peptidogalycan biosysnthesis protein [Bacteroidota bacterium]
MNFSLPGFHVQVFKEVSQAGNDWDQFLSGAPQLNSRHLAALESAQPSDMEFRYVMLRKGDQVVACAYLQLVTFTGSNFSDQGSSLLTALLKFFFWVKTVRLLFCGNLFSVDFPCLYFSEDQISFGEVLRVIKDISNSERCQLMMMKEMNVSSEKLELLKQQGFRKYGEDLTMALEMNPAWQSFDDYFDTLTKKYRKRLKVIRSAKEKITVRNLSSDEIQLYLSEIGELFRATAAKQFLKMGIVDERYFTAMRNAYGEKFFINGYFLQEKLIAFASHISHAEILEVHYIGINYSFNTDYALYFNILYDGVEQAMAMKKKILELGRTAREAKASVGCTPVPSHDYLFVRNRFINFLITVFEKLFLKDIGDEWRNRHPFKTVVSK